jgi:hypothetical protein
MKDWLWLVPVALTVLTFGLGSPAWVVVVCAAAAVVSVGATVIGRVQRRRIRAAR